MFRLAAHSWKDRPEIKEGRARTGPRLPRSRCLFLTGFVSGGFFSPSLSRLASSQIQQ